MDHLGAAASLEIVLDGAATRLELLTKLGEEARSRIGRGAGRDLVPESLRIEKCEVQRWSTPVRVEGEQALPRRSREGRSIAPRVPPCERTLPCKAGRRIYRFVDTWR
jgi:hypothetical protein